MATLVPVTTENDAGKGGSLEDSSAEAELYILTLGSKTERLVH